MSRCRTDAVWAAVVRRASSIEKIEVLEAFGKQNVYIPVATNAEYPVRPVPALTRTQWADVPAAFTGLHTLRLSVITRVGLRALARARCGLRELSVDLFSDDEAQGSATAAVDLKADTAALAAVARRHAPTLRRLRLHLLTTDACTDFVSHCHNLLHLDHGDLHSPAHPTKAKLTKGLRNKLLLRHELVPIPYDDAAAAILRCYAETIRAVLRSCPRLMTVAGLFTQCTVRRRLINAEVSSTGRCPMSGSYAREGMNMGLARRFFADHVFGDDHTKIGDCWNLQYFYDFDLSRIDWYSGNDRMMVEN